MTELESFIQSTPICDTHEHTWYEDQWANEPADILRDIFNSYLPGDLWSSGAPNEAVEAIWDTKNPDIAGRFRRFQSAWELCKHTGYGESARMAGKLFFDLDEFTPENLAAAQEKAAQYHKPGERLRIMRDVANIDHAQVDDFCWKCAPDVSGPDFYYYDLSWVQFVQWEIPMEILHLESGVEVRNLPTLREAIEKVYAKYGPWAIAVKTQHAYSRTLRWEERSDADAARALDRLLRLKEGEKDEAAKLVIGDWCWARGVECAIEHNLPFKMHTGYYVNTNFMVMDRISAENLCPLLIRYPQAKFVLMHFSYPYSDELVAIAKHFTNAYADLCWGWSIDPYSACDFVRRMIHAAPINKLFVFGGDTFCPLNTAGYAMQTRKYLTRALQAEVDNGDLSEKEAIRVASRLMRDNQYDCFDIVGRRARIQEAQAQLA